jgi:probable O-glycosylation ligase (exosortase A-associated)
VRVPIRKGNGYVFSIGESSLRDLIITLFILGSVPKLLLRPNLAVLMFYWLSFMNPHKLCWGFAVNVPFALVTAVSLLLSVLFWREPKKILWMPVNILMFINVLWMTATTFFAFAPDAAWTAWDRMWRIQLISFITMMVMTTKTNIILLIWVVTISLGFYGIKGGIFTILTGGGERVWGPEGTFIGGNNEIGLALCMTVPLIRYLTLIEKRPYIRQGLLIAIVLTLVTILGTQSRGALLGMLGMVLFLIANSRQRFLLFFLLLVTIPLIIGFMPDSWHERMATIKSYDKDGSAMGRINAWGTAFNIAKHNFMGGGFKGLPIPWVFEKYAENPTDIHDAHSIYFQVMAEHGFVGLALFLMIALTAWRLASALKKMTKDKQDLQWIYDLSSMIQVSFIGYWIAGAFLGLADFDLYYCLIATLVCCKTYLKNYTDPLNKTYENEQKVPPSREFVRPIIK